MATAGARPPKGGHGHQHHVHPGHIALGKIGFGVAKVNVYRAFAPLSANQAGNLPGTACGAEIISATFIGLSSSSTQSTYVSGFPRPGYSG